MDQFWQENRDKIIGDFFLAIYVLVGGNKYP